MATPVSIVVDNYNYARFLPHAIDSALAQTWPDTEVIVVDDGSTDGSRAVIAAYGERVKPVLKENGGQASAFNAGFAASAGELVMFLDADDALDESAAEAVAGAWRPGVAKVQFPLRAVDAEGRELGLRFPGRPLPSGDLARWVLDAGDFPSPPTSGNAFHRDVLERLMPIPEEEWALLTDAYLLLLAPLLGEVVSLDRILGSFRLHGGNNWAMKSVTGDRLREYLRYDERRERLMRSVETRFGLAVPRPWVERRPDHMQARLASLRLDPASHPYAGDRRIALALKGLSALRRNPFLGYRKRLLFAAWFVLTAGAPPRLARRLIELGYVAEGRPGALRRMLAS